MITDDRRAFKRIGHKLTVMFKPHSAQGTYFNSSITENISLGGVYFLTFKEHGIGEMVDCLIKINKSEAECTARVVRCEKVERHMINMFGVAVEFVEFFNNSKKNLENIFKK